MKSMKLRFVLAALIVLTTCLLLASARLLVNDRTRLREESGRSVFTLTNKVLLPGTLVCAEFATVVKRDGQTVVYHVLPVIWREKTNYIADIEIRSCESP